ncbi:hypothetical protein MRX96_037839 [Rhipicephalus microplus]
MAREDVKSSRSSCDRCQKPGQSANKSSTLERALKYIPRARWTSSEFIRAENVRKITTSVKDDTLLYIHRCDCVFGCDFGCDGGRKYIRRGGLSRGDMAKKSARAAPPWKMTVRMRKGIYPLRIGLPQKADACDKFTEFATTGHINNLRRRCDFL